MTHYFTKVNTLAELKAEYRRLCMIHHPDLGGDTATMQAINAEYDQRFEQLKQAHNAACEEDQQTTETPEKFRRIVTALLRMDGITVELCGVWLWISGDTRRHKDALKAEGCRWSANKGMWYWRHAENTSRRHRGTSTISQIRTKYGSQAFHTGGSYALALEG